MKIICLPFYFYILIYRWNGTMYWLNVCNNLYLGSAFVDVITCTTRNTRIFYGSFIENPSKLYYFDGVFIENPSKLYYFDGVVIGTTSKLYSLQLFATHIPSGTPISDNVPSALYEIHVVLQSRAAQNRDLFHLWCPNEARNEINEEFLSIMNSIADKS